MERFNLKIGQLGEKIAKEYLQKKGYKILDQNYRTKFTEIDLIAKKGKELVLIEVRTKTEEDFVSPEESLNKKKLRKLRSGAISYVSKTGWRGPYRIDAICIVLKNNSKRLEHYENIA